MPKVPPTISQTIETPLNPANFRSLQRAGWQPETTNANLSTSSFQPGMQFRSLQRGTSYQGNNMQFRPMAQQENPYANSESERQLYAVTEL